VDVGEAGAAEEAAEVSVEDAGDGAGLLRLKVRMRCTRHILNHPT
jgi:hypothetical protein